MCSNEMEPPEGESMRRCAGTCEAWEVKDGGTGGGNLDRMSQGFFGARLHFFSICSFETPSLGAALTTTAPSSRDAPGQVDVAIGINRDEGGSRLWDPNGRVTGKHATRSGVHRPR